MINQIIWAMWARFWLTLSLCTICYVHAEEAPPIKPNRLLIGTVIDTTSTDIVRDAINFVKSVRVFGGTMNDATILVGITSSYNNCASDRSLLPTLLDLNVEVVLLTQTVKHAKTLNKFTMFELFDPIKYDYFLWIDADIIVFDDPMPYLHMHKYPGEVECVPDFYSYMRRFGTVNTSSEYWNPSLPTFHLLGEYETAPSGLCNTGLLFFDSLSLSTFNEGLHRIMSNLSYLEQHGRDRFVDSLIFTEVVQEKALQMSALPFSLNFMALFEIEMQEEAVVTDIVMAHLVSDTEFYCVRTPSEVPGGADACACVYRNKLMSQKGSLLKKTIEEKILTSADICMFFAGAPLPRVETPKPFADVLDNVSTGIHSCTIRSPTAVDFMLRASSRGEAAQLDVSVQCEVPRSHMDAHHSVEFSNQIVHVETEQVLHESTAFISTSAARCSNASCTIDAQYALEFTTSVESTVQPTSALRLVINIGIGHDSQAVRLTASFKVVYENLIPPGQVHYSANLLLSAKPVPLESQLLLPEYLNARQMRGTGVAACCDSRKGVATVKRLIRLWRGDHLLIVVERTPHWEALCPASSSPALGASGAEAIAVEFERLHHLAEELREECNARMRADSPAHNFLCFVSLPPRSDNADASCRTNWGVQVASTLRPDSAQFVYSDVALEYSQHLGVLTRWTQVLSKGGLLVGTQYATARRSTSTGDWNPAPHSIHPNLLHSGQRAVIHAGAVVASECDIESANRRVQASRAADALAWKLAQSALFTHNERDPHYCDAFLTSISAARLSEAQNTECAPAWFLFKQRTSA